MSYGKARGSDGARSLNLWAAIWINKTGEPCRQFAIEQRLPVDANRPQTPMPIGVPGRPGCVVFAEVAIFTHRWGDVLTYESLTLAARSRCGCRHSTSRGPPCDSSQRCVFSAVVLLRAANLIRPTSAPPSAWTPALTTAPSANTAASRRATSSNPRWGVRARIRRWVGCRGAPPEAVPQIQPGARGSSGGCSRSQALRARCRASWPAGIRSQCERTYKPRRAAPVSGPSQLACTGISARS